MQGQEHFPHTHLGHHADSNIAGHGAFCKYHKTVYNLLCNADVDNGILNNTDASVIPRDEFMDFPLAFLSHSLLETVTSSWSVNEFLSISYSPDFDSRLFFTQVTVVKHCHNICDCIVGKHKHSSHVTIITR